jgi:hypothetical protein
MGLDLPQRLLEKTNAMPEYSYGANKVTLILKDGSQVHNVFLAWGRKIVKIDKRQIESEAQLKFRTEDIVDVMSGIS